MSLLTHADLLRTHLLATEGLAGVAVHVDRKFDVRELAAEQIGKRTVGAFVGISLGGWSPQNRDSGPGEYWAELRYELSFSTVPHILAELQMPSFDELLRRIVIAIHGWRPGGTAEEWCADYRWRVGSGSYVPDDDFLVYLFPASVAEDFGDPVELPEPGPEDAP